MIQTWRNKLFTVIQSLYVGTGCDYNPFFAGIGKGSFLRTLFTYAEFITTNGSLSDVEPCNHDKGYLAFLRLVGTAYFFLMHRASYRGTKSPVHLYNSCEFTTALDTPIKWLDKIRARLGTHPRWKESTSFPYSSEATVVKDSVGNAHVGTVRLKIQHSPTSTWNPRLEEIGRWLLISLGHRQTHNGHKKSS